MHNVVDISTQRALSNTKLSEAIVLVRFFGLKPGQTATQFRAELARLSAEEQHELARMAALALGLSQEQLAFELVA